MDNPEISGLRQAVYDIVRLIPRGRATSYAAIARAAGYPAHSRMVGRIMAGSGGFAEEGSEGIPAHRVVNSSGVLSGRNAFGGFGSRGEGRMQALLESEGIIVDNHRIKNWKRVFWNPLDEI